MSREEDAEVIVKGHIKLLHDYNEAKDATQVCHKVIILSIYLAPNRCLSAR